MAVRNNIRKIIESRGIKQTWLSERCGINRTTLSNVIVNNQGTNVETALRIAKTLNMTVEELFELVDD